MLPKWEGGQFLHCLWTGARIQITRNGCTVSLASVLHMRFPGVRSVLRCRVLLFCIMRMPTSSGQVVPPGRRVVHVGAVLPFSMQRDLVLPLKLVLLIMGCLVPY